MPTPYVVLASHWGTRRALGHLARMRALVAPRTEAIRWLEDARDHFAASPARLELARCLTELGARRRANGERRVARSILRDAHDAAFACRALALCERARAELLLAGNPRSRATSSCPRRPSRCGRQRARHSATTAAVMSTSARARSPGRST